MSSNPCVDVWRHLRACRVSGRRSMVTRRTWGRAAREFLLISGIDGGPRPELISAPQL